MVIRLARTTKLAALVLAAALSAAGTPGQAQLPPAASAASAPSGTQAAEPMHRHTALRGDTLIGLGRRFLVDPEQWPEIARVNGLRDSNQIRIGGELLIPLRLMRTVTLPATVTAVSGQASSAGAPLVNGQLVPEGSDVTTGAGGQVTIRLVDGTVLRLRPSTRLQVSTSRRVPDADAVQSGARLEQGRVEVDAAKAPAGRPGFRIETPQGVLGVRGTEFRVASLEQDGQASTRGEVLGGAVVVGGRDESSAAQTVAAGFGTVVDASGRVAPPVQLLPAPDLSALPVLQERPLVRFALSPLAGAAAYRAQISRDASFQALDAEQLSPGTELRLAGLPDGDYLLRVRGVDARGLEGQNALHRFRLKARPEPPLPSTPAPRAVIVGAAVGLQWSSNPQAQAYHLRLARDAAFSDLVKDLPDLRSASATVEGLPPGTYHWQLASQRDGGDQGPWGEPRSFEVRPAPKAPTPQRVGDLGLAFSWEALPGQTFDVQVARDAEFTDLVLEQRVDQPRIDLGQPGTGRFYMRFRARDADGFVGPYSAPQYVEIPNCLRDGSGACMRSADDRPLVMP